MCKSSFIYQTEPVDTHSGWSRVMALTYDSGQYGFSLDISGMTIVAMMFYQYEIFSSIVFFISILFFIINNLESCIWPAHPHYHRILNNY